MRNKLPQSRFQAIAKYIQDHFNLRPELDDFDRVHESFLKESVFKGTNLWILIFAIIIASVGLNMNSTAVIIGAMLISPLMGPINGIGYSLATYDFDLLRKAIKNFSFAVLTSLVASASYFFLTPISTAHSELLARTSPTIYDVLIALFGGLAGIVAISSKQKGNVIPGVAIATALMPPLCTAGYGLATFQLRFFFGAIYLFLINTVFIAWASMVVSRFLKFPIRAPIDVSQKTRVNQLIWLVIWLTVIPSIYFGYGLVKKEQFNQRASNLIENVGAIGSNYLLKAKIDQEHQNVELAYGGAGLSPEEIKTVYGIARTLKIDSVQVKITQGFSFDTFLKKQENEKESYSREMALLRQKVVNLNAANDSLANAIRLEEDIRRELQSLFPQVVAVSITKTNQSNYDSVLPPSRIAIWTEEGKSLNNEDKNRIEKWLEFKLDKKEINIAFIER